MVFPQQRKRSNQAAQDECPTKKQKGIAQVKTEYDSDSDSDQSVSPLGLVPDEMASSNPPSDGRIDIPLSMDVLFGRGKPFEIHPGNKRMHVMVGENGERYNSIKQVERRAFAEKIVDLICGNGARFLKRVEGGEYWVEVSRVVAVEKISHTFRSVRAKGKRKEAALVVPMAAFSMAAPQETSAFPRVQLSEIELLRPPPALLPVLYQPMIGLASNFPIMYGAPLLPPQGLLHPHVLGVPRTTIYDDFAIDNSIRAQIAESVVQRRRQLDNDMILADRVARAQASAQLSDSVLGADPIAADPLTRAQISDSLLQRNLRHFKKQMDLGRFKMQMDRGGSERKGGPSLY